MRGSILNVNISCYLNIKSAVPADVNLLTWLTSDKHRQKVEQIRSLQDEDLQKTIKATLPAITPSGIFSYRDEKHLIDHSGFLVFDIDFKDNSHIRNFDDLREQISHIASVAYCGLSVRGQGFWGLVPIPKSTPEIHKLRFEALKNDFAQFGINLDASGSDICRLRIYSWDPAAYFNHDAKIYTKLPKPKQEQRIFKRPVGSDTRERVEAVIAELRERRIDITNSYKEEWFSVAAALANEFGEGGRGYFHAVSQFHADYSMHDTDYMFDGCLKHRYSQISIGTFFHIAAQYGVTLREVPGRVRSFVSEAAASKSTEHPHQGDIITDVAVRLTKPKVKEAIAGDPWGVEALEQCFKAKELPQGPFRLNEWEVIEDLAFMVEAELAVIRYNNGNERYRPDLERLRALILALN